MMDSGCTLAVSLANEPYNYWQKLATNKGVGVSTLTW